MHEFLIIKDIVIILLVSLTIIVLFNKLNIPSIVGFLIAGIIIGPYTFKLIADVKQIDSIAQIGVILLLFTIGLEVSFKQMLRIKKFVFFGGTLQILLTIFISALILVIYGFDISASIFCGMLISLSSTTIILSLLSEANELDSPHGQISLGVTIFQDLMLVPMILLLPIIGQKAAFSFSNLFTQLLFAFGTLTVIFIFAKFLMPRIMLFLAKIKIKEVFTIGILLMLLGSAYLTNLVGLSFALGAFIAGLILSETEFSAQIVSDIIPMKDAFKSIFFVSVGMLFNVHFVFSYPMTIILVTIAIIVVKVLIVVLTVLLLKYPLRIGIQTGFTLTPIGEFSFVLALAGGYYGLLSDDLYNAFLASSIFTMILGPFLFEYAHYLGFKVSEIKTKKKSNLVDTQLHQPQLASEKSKENLNKSKSNLSNHVIIVGYGLNGKNLARVLKETGIKYVIVELNPDLIREAASKGENYVYGDCVKEEILEKTNIHHAAVIVFAISDPLSSKRGLQIAKRLNPHIYAIVRTRYISEIQSLLALGADEVIPEEFETSLQIFSKVLRRFHIPLNVIMKQVSILRGESYSMMTKEELTIHPLVNLEEILAEGLTDTFFVDNENKFIGKSLSEINLRAITSATIIAIVRNGTTITNPSGSEVLQLHDTLVITGTHQAVDDAFDYLSSK